MTYNGGFLNFTSSESEVNYTLSAENTTIQEFSVNPPLNNEIGPIQALKNKNTLKASFNGFYASLSLNLNSYFLGYNLSTTSPIIKYSGNTYEYFNYSYIFQPSITEPENVTDKSFPAELTNIVATGYEIIIFNETDFAIFFNDMN